MAFDGRWKAVEVSGGAAYVAAISEFHDVAKITEIAI
jgi:hypothetical protein